jgi:hypothetical protein
MQIVVCADDGDQITVNVDDLATEQRIMRLEFHNLVFDEIGDFEPITLTIERARELASAILSIADALGDETKDQPQSFKQGLSDALLI